MTQVYPPASKIARSSGRRVPPAYPTILTRGAVSPSEGLRWSRGRGTGRTVAHGRFSRLGVATAVGRPSARQPYGRVWTVCIYNTLQELPEGSSPKEKTNNTTKEKHWEGRNTT